MTQTQQNTGRRQTTFKRNGLTVECFSGGNGKLARKIERYDRQFVEYTYQYDSRGHLSKVRRDGTVTEHYQYNQRGQRIEQRREYRGFSNSTGGTLHYDEAGRLIRAGDTFFYYDNRGALSERCDCQGVTKFFYGKDTMLDKVILPSGVEIRYEYDKSNPAVPARRFRNGALIAEFAWNKSLRLDAYRDHDNFFEYTFAYDASGILNKVRIDVFKPEKQKPGPGTDWVAASSDWLGSMVAQNRRERLHDFLDKHSLPFELHCGCDQAGTVKILTDRSGKIVKEIVRDSFGVQCGDSFPDLFMPIGFAGGLTDPDTGLVRFGYRDYDPSVGRFTALDPVKDRRGDGDLYDYCVDDPVNRVDTFGLMFSSLNTAREWPETRDMLRQAQTSQGSDNALRGGRLYDAANVATDAANPPQAAQPGVQAPAQPDPAPVQTQAASVPGQAANSNDNLSSTAGAGGAFSGGALQTTVNMDTGTDTGEGRRLFIQALPKAPPPTPHDRPLTRFEELVLEQKLADRETLPQYYKVTSGASLNSGHARGFETTDLRANDDILVYVKNSNVFPVPLVVKAGPSFATSKTQGRILFPWSDAVFRFSNHRQLIRYLSIGSQADSFFLEYQIFSRGNYAPR